MILPFHWRFVSNRTSFNFAIFNPFEFSYLFSSFRFINSVHNRRLFESRHEIDGLVVIRVLAFGDGTLWFVMKHRGCKTYVLRFVLLGGKCNKVENFLISNFWLAPSNYMYSLIIHAYIIKDIIVTLSDSRFLPFCRFQKIARWIRHTNVISWVHFGFQTGRLDFSVSIFFETIASSAFLDILELFD